MRFAHDDMAEIRRGETDQVPLPTVAGRTVWFIVIDVREGAPVVEPFRYTSELVRRLERASSTTRCYAVWNGERSTDLFEMDIPRLTERIEKGIGPVIYN